MGKAASAAVELEFDCVKWVNLAEKEDETGGKGPSQRFSAGCTEVKGSIADLPENLQQIFDPNEMDAICKDAFSMIWQSLKGRANPSEKETSSLLHQVGGHSAGPSLLTVNNSRYPNRFQLH